MIDMKIDTDKIKIELKDTNIETVEFFIELLKKTDKNKIKSNNTVTTLSDTITKKPQKKYIKVNNYNLHITPKEESIINIIKNNPKKYTFYDIKELFNDENITRYYYKKFIIKNNLANYMTQEYTGNRKRLKFITGRANFLMKNFNYSRSKAYFMASEEYKNHKPNYIINKPNTNNQNYNNLDIDLSKFDYKLINSIFYEEMPSLLYDLLIKNKKITIFQLSKALIFENENEYNIILTKILQYSDNILKDLKITGKLKLLDGELVLV
jgi:hypothetical protein